MSRKLFIFLVIAAFALGAVARLYALKWNAPYVHDNALYGTAAESIALRGDMKIGTSNTDGLPHSYSVKEKGGVYLEHNPLWPVLSAPLVKIFGVDGFRATSLLSLLLGLALLVMMSLLGSRLGGETVGLLSLVLGATSYILIDFSGNGSFYIFEAFLYLLFVFLFLHDSLRFKPFWLGLVAGAGILVVHQAVGMVLAYIIYLLFFETGTFKERAKNLLFFFIPVVALYFPWGLRNYFFLGAFFPPADTYYVWEKLGGVATSVSGDITHYIVTFKTLLSLVKTELTNWFPKNLYYINRTLFLLAPVLYPCALLLASEVLFRKKWAGLLPEEVRKLAPLFLVLGAHICISAAWPNVKFRYFTAMVPPVILLGSYFLVRLTPMYLRRVLIGSSVFLMTLLSALTFVGVPSHTYYYGGVLIPDGFREKAEANYVRDYTPFVRDPSL